MMQLRPFSRLARVIDVCLAFARLHPSNVAADVEIFPFTLLKVERVLGYDTKLLTWPQFQDNCVHSIDGPRLAVFRKQFFAADSTGDYVAD